MTYRKFQADAIFDGKNLLPGSTVLVVDKNNRVEGMVQEADAGENIERMRGILCPGFVNAHCHLELSHLKGAIPSGTGMVNFLLQVIAQRQGDTAHIIEAARHALQNMYESGITAIGDICNSDLILPITKASPVKFYHFIEAMGFLPATAADRLAHYRKIYEHFAAIGPAAIVPHAPYSVSPALLQLINDTQSDHTLISIHHAESTAETGFLQSRESEFEKLYAAIGLNIDFYTPPGGSPAEAVLPYFHNKRILLVHNVTVGKQELKTIQQLSAQNHLDSFLCICANANLYIGNGLPNVDLLVKEIPDRLVLGTDSLASNHTLNMMDEVKTLATHFPSIPISTWLQMLTLNGAHALGLEETFGSFSTGKAPGIVLVDPENYRSVRIA